MPLPSSFSLTFTYHLRILFVIFKKHHIMKVSEKSESSCLLARLALWLNWIYLAQQGADDKEGHGGTGVVHWATKGCCLCIERAVLRQRSCKAAHCQNRLPRSLEKAKPIHIGEGKSTTLYPNNFSCVDSPWQLLLSCEIPVSGRMMANHSKGCFPT